LAVLIAVTGTSQDTAAQVPDSSTLLRLNRQLLESVLLRRDTSLLASESLSQLVVVPPGGIVEERAQVLSGVGNVATDSLQIDDVRVVGHGTTAVVLSRVRLYRPNPDLGPSRPSRFMNVFVYDQQRWRLLARSITPCIDRAIAAGRC
jgi:hypothetical protein